MMRFRKFFPKDMKGSITQRDLSGFNRIGVVQQVDPIKGTCVVKWLDHPGLRYDVYITQATSKEWYIPEKGSVVLVEFDSYDRARIVRYMNIGQITRTLQSKSLPKFKEGERMWEVGGTYLHMKRNGDVIISTLSQGILTIENSTGTFKSEFVNLKNITDAGIQYFGIMQRMVPDGNGFGQITNITNDFGDIYSEYRLQIVEVSNGALGMGGISNPIIDIALGTYADSNGIVTAKNGVVSPSTSKQMTINITLNNGCSIILDKEGRMSLNFKSLNFNSGSVDSNDPDIALGLETNNVTLGNKGQHVAREHDIIKIPLTTNYTDTDHLGLKNTVAPINMQALQWLAKSFISPTGPCIFNPGVIPPNTDIQGEITQGAANLIAGDK